MGHTWTTLALFFIFFSGRALIESASFYDCYTFDSSDEGWTHVSDFYWKWSGTSVPDYTNIPAFIPTTGYLWFQDQDTPPASGAIRAPDTFTINYGDTVQATIFRHILVVSENDTDRPVLRFVTGSTVQNVLYSYDYDYWTPVSITCTNTASWETKEARCCVTYPCTGYLQVEGQVNIRDELLGIDDIGVNGACGGSPPPPPPPPPPPSSWCCHFDSSALCAWSPAYITVGWVWSGTVPDPDIEKITTKEYIYIQDTSASATSTVLTDVPDTSTFTISYYFSSNRVDTYNTLVASFKTSAGLTTFTSAPLPVTGGVFVPQTFTAGALCSGAATCSGTFSLTTSNSPGVDQTAALQDFSVNGATC